MSAKEEGVGRLTLVPTPIGNLEDITLRALRVLREADLILAEDTRTASILLKHYEIGTPTRPYHLNNEHRELGRYVELMKGGQHVALLSDAGTPAISDPGYLILRECLREGIGVECLPGATALIPAIVTSGIPPQRFLYEGFLPLKKGRQTRLAEIARREVPVIIYESPRRVPSLLKDLEGLLEPGRQVCLARELSKVHEEFIRGTAGEILEALGGEPPRGECVLIVAPLD